MSRRAAAPVRTVLPDPRFNSVLLSKFMNMVMESGKKSVAEGIVYGAVDRIAEKTGKQADQSIELLSQALDNVKPSVEVKSRRVGGATYQVPVEISFERQESLALRWIVDAANGRKGIPMREAIAAEIIDAYNNTGSVVKKKEEMHKMAQANRAFAHLRW